MKKKIIIIIFSIILLVFLLCNLNITINFDKSYDLNERVEAKTDKKEKLSVFDEDIIEEASFTTITEDMIEVNDLDENFEVINKLDNNITDISGTITFLNEEGVLLGEYEISIKKLRPFEHFIYEDEFLPKDFDSVILKLKGIIEEGDLFWE